MVWELVVRDIVFDIMRFIIKEKVGKMIKKDDLIKYIRNNYKFFGEYVIGVTRLVGEWEERSFNL